MNQIIKAARELALEATHYRDSGLGASFLTAKIDALNAELDRAPARGRVWVTTQPTAVSTVRDCVFETDAEGFVRQVLGGLTVERHRPTFHLTREDAVDDYVSRRGA